jgi:hypothetical protein
VKDSSANSIVIWSPMILEENWSKKILGTVINSLKYILLDDP